MWQAGGSGGRWNENAARCVRAAGLVRLCARSRGAPGTTIALIDGVVERSHPSLREAAIEVVDMRRTASRASSEHATFLASIFAGIGPECLGLVPRCPILDIGVVDDAMLAGSEPARASAARLAVAVAVASARRATIIQLSLDVTFRGAEARALVAAIEAAIGRGIVVVVAAGQRADAPVNPILLVPGVIPVSGTDQRGHPLHSLHRAAAIRVSGLQAPAAGIPGAILPAGIALRTGTSFAACFVTATIALASTATAASSPRDAARRLLSERFASSLDRSSLPLDADRCFDSARSIHEDRHDRYL